MSDKEACIRTTQKRTKGTLAVTELRRSKRIKPSRPDAFLLARFVQRFPPDARMHHWLILEIPDLTRRKLDKWLCKLQLEKEIESSVDLSSSVLSDFPLLSRRVPYRPGRELEITLGSAPTSPQLVEDESSPPVSPRRILKISGHPSPLSPVPCPVISPQEGLSHASPNASRVPSGLVHSPQSLHACSQTRSVFIIPSSEDES